MTLKSPQPSNSNLMSTSSFHSDDCLCGMHADQQEVKNDLPMDSDMSSASLRNRLSEKGVQNAMENKQLSAMECCCVAKWIECCCVA